VTRLDGAGSMSSTPTPLKHHYIIHLLPSPTQQGLQLGAGEALPIQQAHMQTCCIRCWMHVEIIAPLPAPPAGVAWVAASRLWCRRGEVSVNTGGEGMRV
jgi:hypothetical protein